AVVEFVVEDLGPALGRALVSPGSTNERLAAYISTHIDYCRAEPTRAAAIIAAVGYLSRPAAATASQDQPHGSQEPSASQRQAYGQRSADSVGDLVALFEEGQRSGQMRSFDPTTMALSLRSVLDAAVPTHPGIEAHEIIALFDHATRAEEAHACIGISASPYAAAYPDSTRTSAAASVRHRTTTICSRRASARRGRSSTRPSS